MEEHREPSGSDSSDPESVSPAPSLPSPALVAQAQNHRTTNFFIDNILRPDFGCKKELGLGGGHRDRDRDRAAHGSGPRELRVHGSVSRPSLPGTPCPDSNCSSDSTSSCTSSASAPKKSGGGTGGAAGSPDTGTGGGVKAEERAAAAAAAAADNGGSGVVVLTGSAAPTPESQPLLWPAWVYCTRYSDRPSSGKARDPWHRFPQTHWKNLTVYLKNKTRQTNKQKRLYLLPEINYI